MLERLAAGLLLLAAGMAAWAGTPMALPQLAFGGGWGTSCYFFNTTDARVAVTATFIGDDGNALAVPLNGGAAVASTTINLEPRGSAAFEAPNQGTLRQGWIQIDVPGGVQAYGVFRQSVAGLPDQEAVVPLAAVNLSSAALAFDNVNTVTTFALVNTSAVPILVNVVARRQNGTIAGTSLVSLGPKAKTALVLRDLPGMEGTSAQQGTVDFVTSAPGAVALLGLRFLGSAFTSIPAYHGPVTGTVPPAAIPAPQLQVTALSSSEVRLTWVSGAPTPTAFVVERREGAAPSFVSVARLGGAATSFTDTNVTGGRAYTYRVRVETLNGSSPYSAELPVLVPSTVTVGAPTNLQAQATSATTAALTWTNNASNATAVRVEVKTGASGAFVDIGPAPSLTSTTIQNLQPQTTYTFRARAQSGLVFSAYSNEAAVTMPAPPTTVFLIHGLMQGPEAMSTLAGNLGNPWFGLDPLKYSIDSAFNFSDCANNLFCSSQCTIPEGAKQLASYIAGRKPAGEIILVGFSMGGLIAREAMRAGLIDKGRVKALITLGTPNLGYPYSSVPDNTIACSYLVSSMNGDFRQQPGYIVLSPYLKSLTEQWSYLQFPGAQKVWMTAAGRACDEPYRGLLNDVGCPSQNPYNDGVVCEESASYRVLTNSQSVPTIRWVDEERAYAHTNSAIGWLMCDFSGPLGNFFLLSDPPAYGRLFGSLVGRLTSLQ